MAEYFRIPLHHGHVDGPDDAGIPLGGFVKSEGFEFRRGNPHTESARQNIGTFSDTNATFRAPFKWRRSNGEVHEINVTGGIIYSDTADNPSSWTLNSILNTLSPAASTCTLSSNTVLTFNARVEDTIYSGTTAAAPGDYFYFTGGTDGVDSAVQIASGSGTVYNLASAYGGGQTTGAFKILRKFSGTDINFVGAGDRLWAFDGIQRPHWYGKDDGTDSTGSDIFREAGLAPPDYVRGGESTVGSGLLASSATHFWEFAFEDARGNISNTFQTEKVCGSTTSVWKMAFSDIDKAPDWVTRVRVYRNKGGGSLAYHVGKDMYSIHLKSINGDSSSSTCLLDDNYTPALTTDALIGRYFTFESTTTAYRILDNDGTSIEVVGDATGESATDFGYVKGGYDYDTVAANGWTDYTADDDLDEGHQAPTENTQPLRGLKFGRNFRGGGRLCALLDADQTNDDKTQTGVYITGRATTAPKPTADETFGENEFDYWHYVYHAGRQDGRKIKGFREIGTNLYAIKEVGIWKLYQEPNSIAYWFWVPVRGTESVGCLSRKAICSAGGVVYFFGHDSQQVDVIRFDGRKAFGMLRSIDDRLGAVRLRRTMDSMTSYTDTVTMEVYQGRLYISYPSTGTTNNKTLRYDFKTFTADVQPWGCGEFQEPFKGDGAKASTHYLICTSAAGEPVLYNVLGSTLDDGSAIARELITGSIRMPEHTEHEPRWLSLLVKFRYHGDNGTGEALSVAFSYSTDGLLFDSGSKSWTSMSGSSVPTSAGLYVLRYAFKDASRAHDVMIRIKETLGYGDWEIVEMVLAYDPGEQRQRRGVLR